MKRIALLALAAMAMTGASMLPAQADEPVGGLTNSAGCGIHLDHGVGSPFYKSNGSGGWTACTVDDAHP